MKFTKAQPSFFLMNTNADSKTTFQFLDEKLYARHIRANPEILLAHNETLNTKLALYNLKRVELKTFTFSKGTQSFSINNAVVGRIPERLLFTMLANTEFLSTIDTNPYKFQYFNPRTFAMYVNGGQIFSESLSLDPGHEKRLSWDKSFYVRALAFNIRTPDFQ